MKKEIIKEYLNQISEQLNMFRDPKIKLEETYRNIIQDMIIDFNSKLESDCDILESDLNKLYDIFNNYYKLISDTDFVMKQII